MHVAQARNLPSWDTLSEGLWQASDVLNMVDNHLNAAGVDACKVLAGLRNLSALAEDLTGDQDIEDDEKQCIWDAVQTLMADASMILSNLGQATDHMVNVAGIHEQIIGKHGAANTKPLDEPCQSELFDADKSQPSMQLKIEW
eukprot:361241-Chlamydomonas_euryale.AAC.3